MFMVQVAALAKICHWKIYHVFDSRRSCPGWPDLFLVRADGRALAMELKVEGQLTESQREWLQLLEAAGIEARVWRPSDWEQIERILR
jgi:hypothetical protein